MNYYLSRWDVDTVGICHHTLKKFPSSAAPDFDHVYTVFYWSQDINMPVNRALASCTKDAPPHCLLQGDVLVLKHEQEIEDSYLLLERDDIGLLSAALGWFIQGLHVFVSDLVDAICSAIGLGELDHVNEMDYMFYAIVAV